MSELHLYGWICSDNNGIYALSEEKDAYADWKKHSIIESIESIASESGYYADTRQGLGGRRAIIEDCNLKIYFTDEECELEEAMMAFDEVLYGGEIQTKVSKVGYSEYTIEGLNLDEFTIGGHDLKDEFGDHYGEYCHIIIEY